MNNIVHRDHHPNKVHEQYQHASHIRSPWSIRKETWSTLTTNLVNTEDYLGSQKINMVHVVMITSQTLKLNR